MTKDVEFPPDRAGAADAVGPMSDGAPAVPPLPAGLGAAGDPREPLRAWSGRLPAGFAMPAHAHPRAQLALCFDGLMRLEVGEDIWFIPDRHGVWIPPGLGHALSARAPVELQNFYVHPRFVPFCGLPDRPTVVRATPLLRGIARRLAPDASARPSAAQSRRLAFVALDEMTRLERADLHLPGARDPRLAAVMEALLADPGARQGLAGLAARAGVSERTLGRLFRAETGLSWRDWHQRLRFLLAIEGLESGETSGALAARLGYSSASAFIAAFRRQFGVPPSAWRRAP
ncbi:MAG: helix-turn-helix domain-containing protein [Paenirhodobacter sp.]|uniref:AraC family transcriptional regulator n=1 Tax=Paenirhodobacter sp. TaxID=1965326 RepID=UPI003D0D3884